MARPKRTTTKAADACLYPPCVQPRKCRGLCTNHYVKASRLVTGKLATWEALEKSGRVLPARHGGNRAGDAFRQWITPGKQPRV